MDKDLKYFKELLFKSQLPDHDFLFNLAEKCSVIMETEFTDYRPPSDSGIPGGVLDYRNSSLPLVVVPDIHARPKFVYNILKYPLTEDFLGTDKSYTVLEALDKKLINLVCVGDALHSEHSSIIRWFAISTEFKFGITTGTAMTEEMKDGLNTICSLMELKCLYPENFQFLKGNHENIMNKSSEGDYGFRKYADEGKMVRTFITDYYGDDVLYILSCVEYDMPLIFVNQNCVISHAEPKKGFTKNQLINARADGTVVEGLTWTDNDAAEDGSVELVIKNLAEMNDIENYIYLGGHRPVSGLYKLRQNGKYIQFHNPGEQHVALVKNGQKFDPDFDLVDVDTEY